MLQRDWLEVDETLGNVMSSVAHLRCRIALEQQQVSQLEKHKDDQNNDDWKTWGFHARDRHLAGMTLTRADLHMTLSRDLLQHESMCSTARRLLASLAQTQDALGRRLDEMMQWEIMTASDGENNNDDDNCTMVISACQQLYSKLALELYRKQCLVHQVLESVHNGILWSKMDDEDHGKEDVESTFEKGRLMEELHSFDVGSDDPANREDPIQVADACVRQWPLVRQSYWDGRLLEQVKGWQ
jgi:hypothetical protein